MHPGCLFFSPAMLASLTVVRSCKRSVIGVDWSQVISCQVSLVIGDWATDQFSEPYHRRNLSMHACDIVPPSYSIWPFVCEQCGKGSKTKSNMRNHLNRKHSNMYQSTDQSIHNYTILIKTKHGPAPIMFTPP